MAAWRLSIGISPRRSTRHRTGAVETEGRQWLAAPSPSTGGQALDFTNDFLAKLTRLDVADILRDADPRGRSGITRTIGLSRHDLVAPIEDMMRDEFGDARFA